MNKAWTTLSARISTLHFGSNHCTNIEFFCNKYLFHLLIGPNSIWKVLLSWSILELTHLSKPFWLGINLVLFHNWMTLMPKEESFAITKRGQFLSQKASLSFTTQNQINNNFKLRSGQFSKIEHGKMRTHSSLNESSILSISLFFLQSHVIEDVHLLFLLF